MKITKAWWVRWLKRGAIGFLCFTLFFLWLVGWFSKPQSWQHATGWDQLNSEEKPAPPPTAQTDDPQLTWLGHSGFLIVWHGTRLLLDPNLSSSCRTVPRLFEQPLFQWESAIDACLISHAHYDHFDLPTLLSIPQLGRLITPAGLDAYLPDQLKTHYQGMGEEDRVTVGALEIIAVYTKHRGGRYHPFESKDRPLGYVITDGHTTLYYPGDTGYGPHFRKIAQTYHPDLAILPIGAYDPRFLLRPLHLNPEEAVQAALDLGVKTVVPCHYGTFWLSFDSPAAALPRFARAASNQPFTWYHPPLAGIKPENVEPN